MNSTSTEQKTIESTKDYPGLMNTKSKSYITRVESEVKYIGPKIPPHVWHQVLSFFKWTYDTTKSESQVRLFHDPVDNTWIAWAFPQEAKTGMTAREIPGDGHDKQRSELPHSGELTLFGTVHHHCDAGAFQSGTDENNEKNQAGLHITVGKMDEAKHDLHVRFYLGGVKYEPDMSEFWDVGEQVASLIPKAMHEQVARHQMCIPSSVEFPEQWKANLIEIKSTPVTVPHHPGGGSYTPVVHGVSTGVRFHADRMQDAEREFFVRTEALSDEYLLEWAGEMMEPTKVTVNTLIVELADKYNLSPKDILRSVVFSIEHPAFINEVSSGSPGKKGKKGKGTGEQHSGREDFDPVTKTWTPTSKTGNGS